MGAIGTVVDQKTLDVQCWPERCEANKSIEVATQLWRSWAEEDPAADCEEAEGTSNNAGTLDALGVAMHEADADMDRSMPQHAQLTPSGAKVRPGEEEEEEAEKQIEDELGGSLLSVDELRSRTADV